MQSGEGWLMERLASANLSADEYQTVAHVGLAAVKQQRKAVDAAIKADRNVVQEERE